MGPLPAAGESFSAAGARFEPVAHVLDITAETRYESPPLTK